ncbi:MAG TPA: DUF5050 domain-containing protein [Firmicutes bacterium]|nr:DUF5050 domain-containing protein [Bacillota bacterium]
MKIKPALLLLIAVSLIFGGCTNVSAPGESGLNTLTTNYPVATPAPVPDGVIADSVPGRFALYNGNIYYASSDSISMLEQNAQSTQALTLCDTPSRLEIIDGVLYYLAVAQRDDNFSPVSYTVNSVNLSTGEELGLAYCEQNWYYIYEGNIYTLGEEGIYSQEIGQEEQSLVMSGFITSPAGYGGSIYMSLGEDLAVYDISSSAYEILLEDIAPMNITPLEDGLLYSDEVSEYMYFYDYDTGSAETVNGAPNYGVTIYEGEYYYVSNNGTAALYRLSEDGSGEKVLELGELFACSVPCFSNGNTYFVIHADDYIGLVEYDETGAQTRLSVAGG